jgi:hypothetical protein
MMHPIALNDLRRSNLTAAEKYATFFPVVLIGVAPF